MKIKSVYRISDTFKDYYLLKDGSVAEPKLEKLNTCSRTINGNFLDDLFCLEPSTSYLISVTEGETEDYPFTYITAMGLLLKRLECVKNGEEKRYTFAYNISTSQIYLEKGAELI